jgi:hypothetical protein
MYLFMVVGYLNLYPVLYMGCMQGAKSKYFISFSSLACVTVLYFSKLSHIQYDFLKKLLVIKSVLIFFYNL